METVKNFENWDSSELRIELYQGAVLIGPAKNETQIRELAKKIEEEMMETYDSSMSMGSESRAMDDRDDIVYDYEDEIKALGFEIEE